MKKTITIYELLGLIKEGKAPYQINYRNKTYSRGWGDYMDDESINEYYVSGNVGWNDYGLLRLDDEVEILDEEEFEDIEECFAGVELEYSKNSIEYKINQLIRNQKKIIERLNKDK